jgi:hypothetical protein
VQVNAEEAGCGEGEGEGEGEGARVSIHNHLGVINSFSWSVTGSDCF